MKHILAILAVIALIAPANAQTNTEGLLEFTRQRLAQPTPALKPVPLPPVEFDHAYTGQVIVTKWNDYSLIRFICKDTPNPIACSFRTYDSASGETISCLIMLGPDTWSDERAMRHEMAHCNGWPGDHPGARYSD
jgi:hypothetical protein